MERAPDILKLSDFGFKRLKKNQYFLLSAFDQFIIIKENNNKYSLVVDGIPIKSKALSFNSLIQILSILY